MSTAEFPKPSDLVPEDELVPPPVEIRHAGRNPSSRRTTRRWELGAFVRRTVNGWLVYFKRFPPSKTPTQAPSPPDQAPDQVLSPPTPPDTLQGRSEGKTAPPAEVKPLSGHSSGSNEGGPVGQSHYEAGLYLSSHTSTTYEEDEDS